MSQLHPELLLWLQVLSKTMDSTTLSPEKVELATVTRNESTGEVSQSLLEIAPYAMHRAAAAIL